MNATKKAIHFDLSTEELKKVFEDTREPYNQIKRFMLQNGFEHHQYSGYVSQEPLTDRKILLLSKRLAKALPWLGSCIKEFDVTNISAQYSLKDEISKAAAKTININKEYIPKKRKRNKNR